MISIPTMDAWDWSVTNGNSTYVDQVR